MARVRTVDFLPEIFQTSTNKQFLSATLDQLVQEPSFKKIQGFVGRRVGPGVNPNDEYIKEIDAVRTDYQLEPGVILKKYNTNEVQDAITYPGITDAIGLAGGFTNNADRLYTSEYYTWDPFVDFDKFVNFSQYYWLPGGPDAVEVFSGQIPLTNDYTVTRANGVYTFSGLKGDNPTLRLVRGGTYTFNISQNNKETQNFRVSNSGTSAFVIDYQNNPTLTLVRGNTYVFSLVLNNYSFYIKTDATLGTTNQYTNGVTNNGAITGNITFVVPQDAPDTLYYCNDLVSNLRGTINVVDADPGTGPGFWIQADPGVSGNLISTPNISGRTVLGVNNNGTDLGTVTFNVPLSTAQNFYYTLTDINSSLTQNGVDLVTDISFEVLDGLTVEQFLIDFPTGIDGITNIDGKTIAFVEAGVGPASQGIWEIKYVTDEFDVSYISLNLILPVEKFQKFSILYGTKYSSTQWYKNSQLVFEQIPLLTAGKSLLYYQDGTDPDIFGRIQLVEQDNSDEINVDEIIGKKNYISPNGVVFTNGLKVRFIGNVIPAEYANNSYYVEGVGTAIKLLPATDFVTPETYIVSTTPNQPLVPEYLTINRASPDHNPWSRENRWFHIDVINATAEYNNSVAVLDNNFRGKRPILEFRAGTKLYNFGTQGKQPVNIVDFTVTDALSNINGSTGYGIDGYRFVNGTRVIFAADTDPEVRNKIYTVEFITPDTVPPLIAEPIINLVPADDGEVLINQTVFCLSGNNQIGKSFYYDGITWYSSQQKTEISQAPLFDVYDLQGISYGDRAKYPSSNFNGSKLFSYATGNGVADTVLGFPLKYLSLNNVGDIVFDNNLYKDSFIYTRDNVSTTVPISQGYVKQYSNRIDYIKEIGWQPAVSKSRIRQQFSFVYDGSPFILDVPVDETSPLPALQIYVSGIFVDPGDYTYAVSGDTTTITINIIDEIGGIGSVVEVDALSSKVSKVAFYQVPINLENNPLNGNSESFTLGTIRSHYETIGENLKALVGPINGANNTRDLGDIIPYGENILQQSAPLTMAGYFMRSNEYNIFAALEYNSKEYEKYKARLLDIVTRNDYTNYTIPDMLTAAINDLNLGKTENYPFYWSDMLPASSVYTQSTSTITLISTNVFNLSTTYDFNSSNYKGLLVYLNDVLLTIDADYVVSPIAPKLTITAALNVGDVVVIREYATTYGNFVPNTPTKMGLYPSYRPRIYVDTNYVTPQTVIQGHDGSLTMAFGDFRDQLLLEFETRIFNNLKIKSEIPLPVTEVMPGQFRTTDYSLAEVNQILSNDFLSWIGWNKLNYQSQDYVANNPFTWNYSACGNKLTGPNEVPVPVGAWRGLYLWFYDTTSPNTTPWQMLGFSIKPDWWNDVYGPAPYTSDNLVLWDDLAAGKVADPAGEYYLPQYARPQLTQIIPTGTSGELLPPFDSVVGYYDVSQFEKSWNAGDMGPVEYTWRSSSSYPFAVMRLLALTRPAEFFALFTDRDLYKFDTDYNQYLYNDRYRLDANGIEVYGNGVSKASYIDWIVDFNRQTGLNSSTDLAKDLSSLDVRLCYRIGAFTDKQYLSIYTEKSSPNSLNSSLLLPDESYSLLLYKNQPFNEITYSSVIFQVVEGGYAVYGYSLTNPYFEVLVSKTYGTRTTIAAGGEDVTVPNQYTDQVVQIPYGHVFTNRTVVVDFLLSYGALLTRQGLVFDDRENGHNLNWNQMAQEFLYWANQGWEPGAVINLNPAAFSLTAVQPLAIVDSIVAQTPQDNILDQNRSSIPVRDLVVDRFENTFKVTSLTQQTISYLNLKFTSYESMVVLDNISVFNDLLYNPITGARQNRINVTATVSSDWNGQLDAQGFIYNDIASVKEWQPNRKYAKGEIVIYKNNYWSAQTIVQPKVEFDYGDWVKSDYTKIQRGLLQNLPNLSNQLINSYNVNTANLGLDQDLVSFGLIGFRPRQYLSGLNLDDISQVNVYKQFLKDKGTIRSVQLIGQAKTEKEVAEYDLYENWAILRGTYGANANKSFIELRLNEADLQADPSTVQVVTVGQNSQADQQILLTDLWRQSYKIPNTDIFTTTVTPIQDLALPTAGYVNLDDVDITVFSLDGQLQLAPGVLNSIGNGTTIWAAKVNAYDWGVYRSTSVPGFISEISNNLNSTSVVGFTQQHNLAVGNVIVIRNFNDAVNGVYKVLAVPSPTTIVIELTTTKNLTGNGIAFVLMTMRVSQASNVLNLSYTNSLISGNKVWVDNNGQGLWAVYEKQTPFTEIASKNLPVENPIYQSRYGTSVSQGYKNIIAVAGAPGWSLTEGGTQVGAVYPYIRNVENQYAESTVLTLGTTDTLGYGNSVDVGGQSWIAAGASASNSGAGYASVIYRPDYSNVFDQQQLLVAPDQDFGTGEFGYAVSVSANERWLYVGAPGNNKVYAFARQDIQPQSVIYRTDGATKIFSFDGYIDVNPSYPSQLLVVYNNKLLVLNQDYIVSGTEVILNDFPPRDQKVTIQKKFVQQIDNQTYFGISQDATSGSGSGAKFTVVNKRGEYGVSLVSSGVGYNIGDTITIYGTNIGTQNSLPTAATSPANDLTITVINVDAGAILDFVISGTGVTNNYIFPLNPYFNTITDIWSFSILVNGALQRPFIDYTFSTVGPNANSVVFLNVPAAGALIEASSSTQFTFVDILQVPGIPANARFGASIAQSDNGRSIVIGAPVADSTVNNSGVSYVFDRGAIKYIVDNAAQTTFALPAGFAEPVAVLVNGQYLTNAAQYINGQFSVVGSDVVLNNVDLNVGDVVEIENNIFNLIQIIQPNAAFDEAQFGSATDICPTNCSLYIGAPTDGTVVTAGGSVERYVNQSRLYGVITSLNANPVLNIGDNIRINNQLVELTDTTVESLSLAINSSGIPNVTSKVVNGLLTISVINTAAATEFNKLTVLPGTIGTAFDSLGFNVYAYTQTITSPNPVIAANFGAALSISSDSTTLIVGAPGGNAFEPMIFDHGTTYFDERSTTFSDTVIQSGVVYSFDLLSSSSPSINNPAKFVFGQQIYDTSLAPLDSWGGAVSYVNGKLLVGAPGSDLGDSSVNYGRAAVFENLSNRPAWYPIHVQTPVADVNLFNTVFMYDKLQSSRTHFFDFINPLQGKILGAARQNIDYISSDDPAKYNMGPVNNNGNFWAQEHIGQIWWDISSVRFIDPSQNDLSYASRRWGQVFPGSTIEVYQWVESNVPPAQYTGPGTPIDTTRYTLRNALNQQGVFDTVYYFWVTGIDTIDLTAGKTLSTVGIARYIESPKSSGVPYIAPIDANTVAIYNGLEYISAADTILHIGYDREYTQDNIHTEFELIAQENPDSFLSANLYRKLQDSFCGVNETGAAVPDPMLSPAERYGIQYRPRQNMFVDRLGALKNYLEYSNSVLAQYPISESRTFYLLNSSEPKPTSASGAWDKKVANLQELSYQDLYAVPLGYTYLVDTDSTQNGLWTIYTVEVGPVQAGSVRYTQLTRVQNYDTKMYWNYIDWYEPSYNRSVVPVYEVKNYSALASVLLSTPVGASVKVTANAQGKWEIYQRVVDGWNRVGLQDGTIEFKNILWDYLAGRFGFDIEVFDAQYFDQEPVVETRKIIQAINEELFIDDLAIYRNRALILTFEFILSEFQAPDWLMKTSLIDVNHKIRELLPFQVFHQDNQTFVLDYINEVKPYHVQIREFNLTYNGQDQYTGSLTDFDIPSYYDRFLEIPQYVSPILLPYTKSTAVGTGTPSSIADIPADGEVWTLWPWVSWYNHYLLELQSIQIIDGGEGYTEPPTVTATGDAVVQAQLESVINSLGQVVAVNVIDPGHGYLTTAQITFSGGNGNGARAYAVMGNQLVRSFKTVIKYDRCEYQSTVVDWQANVTYYSGDLVRHDDKVYTTDSTITSSIFDPDQWTYLPASELNSVDRTIGYYAPTVNQPGRQLSLLIDGVAYPGVQVMGVGFNQNTGYDIGNFDINPYDNLSYGPEGLPTYDQSILDAIYESYYPNPPVQPLPVPTGLSETDINVEGGGYVDTYSSFAPEELVPGAEFDTLDFRVYTRPGADWLGNGHGFATYSVALTVDTVPQTFDFSTWFDSIPYPVTMILYNGTQGLGLIRDVNYTIDWVAKTITVISGVAVGNYIEATSYGAGGGNQLYRANYIGSDIGNQTNIPVGIAEIQEIDVWVNGDVYRGTYTLTAGASNSTNIEFSTTFTATDWVVLYALGPTVQGSTTVDYSWSAPVIQTIIADGSSISFELDNSLEYTNPVNPIVLADGSRLRTASTTEYTSDGVTVSYYISGRLGFSPSTLLDSEIEVYVNQELQTNGVDYIVVTGFEVLFNTAPAAGDNILIAVTKNTQAKIVGNNLVIDPTQGYIPILGSIIQVITWNDTRQQDIVTTVYVGPVTSGITVYEGYDSVSFDSATVNNDPGSFDFAAGAITTRNNLFLQRPVTDPDRLWVTLNGIRLFYGNDFNIVNDEIILPTGLLSSIDVVMISEFTNSIVPDAMAFRIFQDMRGVQATYRITTNSTTALVQPLGLDDDTIYVDNAAALDPPDFAANIWGILTIDGERIMYRQRDLVTNTVTGLMRGTAGTAIDTHSTGTSVYAMGRNEIMPAQFQNYIDSNSFLSDGIITSFEATNVVFDAPDSTFINEAVEVYVGGTRITDGYTISGYSPVTVNFDAAPAAGSEVTILVRRGVTWYAPGAGTPSNGVPLQDTNTQAARFLRGL